MYQPSIECENYPNRIRADDPLFIHKICAECVERCDICDEIINGGIGEDTHYREHRRVCYKHYSLSDSGVICMICDTNVMNCYNCDKFVPITTMSNWNRCNFPNAININLNREFIFVCKDCDLHCLYCVKLAISDEKLCSMYELGINISQKDIIYPFCNQPHIAEITAILIVLRHRHIPRPLQIAIIRFVRFLTN